MASSGRAEEKLSAVGMQRPQQREEEESVAVVTGTVGVRKKRPREEEEIFAEPHPLPGAETVAAPLPLPPVLRPEEVAAAPVKKICHQCRQYKTELTPTCSGFRRNKPCTIRYCAKCYLNRYGQGEVESSQEDGWTCPKCRGTCNCSCCRKKNGELPTGKLVDVTKTHGCTSAREVLESVPHVMDKVHELRGLSGKKQGTKRARRRNATIAGLGLQDEDVGVGAAIQFWEFCRTVKEMEAKKRRLERANQRKLRLLAEVKFLRRKYKFLVKCNSQQLQHKLKGQAEQIRCPAGFTEASAFVDHDKGTGVPSTSKNTNLDLNQDSVMNDEGFDLLGHQGPPKLGKFDQHGADEDKHGDN